MDAAVHLTIAMIAAVFGVQEQYNASEGEIELTDSLCL